MSINMKTLTQALAKTAAVIEKTVHTTVQEVTGPKPLQDYALLHQVGSAGPGMAWKLYSARARAPSSAATSQYATVCVWVLDKRAVSEARARAGLTRAAEEAFLDLVRADAARLVRLRHPGVVHVVQAFLDMVRADAVRLVRLRHPGVMHVVQCCEASREVHVVEEDAARLVRLKHPGVVHVVQGLDEGKSAMAMVTEPLFASVANALGDLENVVDVPKELKGMEMGLLEVKHGLLQLAESLNFLHNNARLVHRALAPESVLITASGAWKLGGFGFAVQLDQGDSVNLQTFHYAEYDVEDALLPLQPSLNYTAPELIRNKASSSGWSSDIFSFACLAYHLIARKPLFDCHNNVKMYMNNLNYLSSEAFSSIPPDLVPDLQKMLSVNETFRPSALDFTGSLFFRNDTRLRALRFLDHLLERDNMQKSEFLKALSDMWKDFDSRVLRYKVLPPLCAELRNIVMQPMILPMVLTIAESQDKSDFELSTLPALVPVLSTATGETLLLLLKHADLVINKASQEHLISHVLPFFVRAYDDTDPRMQEEGLKRTFSFAKHLDVQLVTETLLPRVHALALRTTVAAVRVNALLCLGEMVHMLDKPSVLGILQTIQRCTAVDRSAPTLMCTLGIANSILKQHGLEFVAEHVLPLITPLLIVQQLNVQQFAKYMLFVKDILRKIEEKRGVAVSETGFQDVKQPSFHDVRQAAAVLTAVPSTNSTANNKHSWDEDWVPTSKPQPTTTQSSSSSMPSISNPQKQTNLRTSVSVPPNQQNGSSCPPIDVEWPPRSGSIARPQPGDIGNQNHNQSTATSSTIDEIDPFANWPPRSTVHTSASISPANGILPSTNISNNSWAFNTTTSVENHPQNRGALMTGNGVSSGNNQNSMRAMKQNQAISAPGSYSGKASTNIGSIFVSNKNDLTAPRLAPPPSTAVGRGRGGRGRARGTPGQPEQPPLLDLL